MFGACAVQLTCHTCAYGIRACAIYTKRILSGYCSAHAQYVLRRLDAFSAAEEAGLVRLRIADCSLSGRCMHGA